MEQIKIGDVVSLKNKSDKSLSMTVGSIHNGVAICYWSSNYEIKHAEIHVDALTKIS